MSLASYRSIVALARPPSVNPSPSKDETVTVETRWFPITCPSPQSLITALDIEWSPEPKKRSDKWTSLHQVVESTSVLFWTASERLDILYLIGGLDDSPVSCSFTVLCKREIPVSSISPDRWFQLIACKLSVSRKIFFPRISEANRVRMGNGANVAIRSLQQGWAVERCPAEQNHRPSLGWSDLTALMPDILKINSVIESTPKGYIEVTCCGRRYRVVRLTGVTAAEQRISLPRETVTVLEYFARKKINIAHANPLAVDDRGRYLPLELCLDSSERSIESGDFAGETDHLIIDEMKKLGFTFEAHPVKAAGRVLAKAPSNNSPQRAESWPEVSIGILSFASQDDTDNLVNELVGQAGNRGLRLVCPRQSPCIVGLNFEEWETVFKQVLSQQHTTLPDLFIAVSPNVKLPADVYSRLKLVLERKLNGIPSQVFSLDNFILRNASNRRNEYWDSVISQLVLKAGIREMGNYAQSPPTTTIVGIWTETIPKTNCDIVCVTMSVDHGFVQMVEQSIVVERSTRQSHTELNDVFYELLGKFFQINGGFPNRIISYRRNIGGATGVHLFSSTAGEIQAWHAALNRIGRELKTGINSQKFGISIKSLTPPNITIVDCQCTARANTSVGGNHSLSCLVFDNTIIDPIGLNFIIRQQHKSHHFRVLHDQNNFSINEIINFTHRLNKEGNGLPIVLARGKLSIQRSKLYMQNEWSAINELRKGMKNELPDYLNQKLFSQASYNDSLSRHDRVCYV